MNILAMGPRKKNRTLAEAGEYAFIERIRHLIPSEGGDIVRSIGDDCLVVKPLSGNILMTTDTFVDMVHFSYDFITPHQTGQRCMAASVSDIAAMAGFPQYALVSLSLPSDMFIDDAVALFKGLQSTAEYYECPICGGETTSTPGPTTITVTVIGESAAVKPVLRSGAQVGDAVYVTGTLGDAMGGLMAYQQELDGYDTLKQRYATPLAQVTLARSLNEIYKLTAMIDLSDGLGTDLKHVCDESACSAEIEEEHLPVSDELRSLLHTQKVPNTDFITGAGEDFGLLFTSADKSLADSFHFMNQLITRIGTITQSGNDITVRRANGTIEPLQTKGYEHFKR